MPTFTAEEKDQLERMEKFDSNWRVRERVKSLVLLSQGQTCLEVAGQIGIHFRTVSYTRQGLLQEKYATLSAKPRCVASLKMTPGRWPWAETAPLSGMELLARQLDAGGPPVHAQTIKSVLRKEDFVWKRTRASLKKRK